MAAAARSLADFPLFRPPPRRYRGPIVDAHMHSRDADTIASYWEVAETPYGIRYAVPIVDLNTAVELKRRYPGRVEPAVWGIFPRNEDLRDWPSFRRNKEALLQAIHEAGMKIVKLWFTPRFTDWWNLRMDDPALDFFFQRIEALGLAVLVHVADPDRWFARMFQDREQHGSKAEHFPQLVSRLEQHPGIVFQAAHFAADPEHLDHLQRLLERYPNLILDCNATKWIAREFSRQGRHARDFLIAHKERIVFGTDLVASPEREKEGRREHYATRFYVHQLMWEGQGTFASPIEDEDDSGSPWACGLDLPQDVLQSFYWDNAARLYGFSAASGPAAR
jgi:predicted TIM-barrel fold metal-dependent hydrolase